MCTFFCLETQVRNKWKTFNQILKAEISNMDKQKSGSEAKEVKSDWVHFDAMQFAADNSCKKSSGNITTLLKVKEDMNLQLLATDNLIKK